MSQYLNKQQNTEAESSELEDAEIIDEEEDLDTVKRNMVRFELKKLEESKLVTTPLSSA